LGCIKRWISKVNKPLAETIAEREREARNAAHNINEPELSSDEERKNPYHQEEDE
jgi:hypothetical protein